MTDIDIPQVQHNNTSDSIYKRWHRSGFINIGFFAKAEKVTIEIGSTDGDKGLKSATKCFVPAAQFIAYLYAEINGNLLELHPQFADKGITYFGGGQTPDKGVISRVFKTSYWGAKTGTTGDVSSRAFKCGHFEGNRTSTDAITPDYSKPLSQDMIKIGLAEIAEIYQIVHMTVLAHKVAGVMKDAN